MLNFKVLQVAKIKLCLLLFRQHVSGNGFIFYFLQKQKLDMVSIFLFYQFFVTEQIIALSLHDASHKDWGSDSDLPCCAVARVIKQCCFNSTPDPFNGQTANFILKPKVIESRTYVKS